MDTTNGVCRILIIAQKIKSPNWWGADAQPPVIIGSNTDGL